MPPKVKPAIKKQLTPAKFGLADEQPYTRRQLLQRVPRQLATFESLGQRQPTAYPGYHPRMIAACRLLLEASRVGGAPNSPLALPASRWPAGLTDADLAIIGSDFGEVAGALYLLSTKQVTIQRGATAVPLTFTHVIFPSDPANKLVDYIAVASDGAHYNISAKYVKGGAPAISAIHQILNTWIGQPKWDHLADVGLSRETHLAAVGVMSLLGIERNQPSVSDLFSGPLEAAQFLSALDPSSRPAQAYRALDAALSRTPAGESWNRASAMTVDDMQTVVESLGHTGTTTSEIDALWETMTQWLTPYWTAAGIVGKFDVAAIKRRWARPEAPRFGPLHFPLTYALLNWLNTPANGALDVLTAAARTLQVCQLRLMNLKSAPTNGIVYRWEPFHEHHFEFWSPSHTVLPLNNRMGFRLK